MSSAFTIIAINVINFMPTDNLMLIMSWFFRLQCYCLKVENIQRISVAYLKPGFSVVKHAIVVSSGVEHRPRGQK